MLLLEGLIPDFSLHQDLVGVPSSFVPRLAFPREFREHEVVQEHRDVQADGDEQEEYKTNDPAGKLKEFQCAKGPSLVLHLHVWPFFVDQGPQGKVAAVGPVSHDNEDDTESQEAQAEEGVKDKDSPVPREESTSVTEAVLFLLFLDF